MRDFKLREHVKEERICRVEYGAELTATGEILAAIDCTLEASFGVTIASYAVSFDYDA